MSDELGSGEGSGHDESSSLCSYSYGYGSDNGAGAMHQNILKPKKLKERGNVHFRRHPSGESLFSWRSS